jgi:hypothetical protein
LRYTIEARELTSESTHRPTSDVSPRQTIVDADDAGAAINRFVRESQCELVSISPSRGTESIATVRKEDAVYLVRVYAD